MVGWERRAIVAWRLGDISVDVLSDDGRKAFTVVGYICHASGKLIIATRRGE